MDVLVFLWSGFSCSLSHHMFKCQLMFDKYQIRSTDLLRSDLKIEADRHQKSGKLRSLLIFMDLYCGSLSIFINLIDLFQNQQLWNSDLYHAIKVAILSNRRWPRGRSLNLHSMQFRPLLLNVCVESLSFKKKKLKRGQDFCSLPLDPQLQY